MQYYKRNLIVLTFTIFLAAVSWNQVMPFLPLFIKSMGVKKSVLQWSAIVFAAQAIASILAQPFWGKLGDSVGRKPMILRAGFCLAGIYLGMSFCQTPLQLAFFRFLNGALTGFIPGSITLIATNTPSEIAPRSVATAHSASAAGLIVGPALGGALAALLGYRGSMQASSAACLIATILVWLLVEEPNKAKSTEKTSLVEDFMASVRSPIISATMVASMAAWASTATINFCLTLYLKELSSSVTEWQAGLVVSLPALAFVLSAQMWTRRGETWSFERSVVVGFIGAGVTALGLYMTRSVVAFAIAFFVFGMWQAAVSPSVSSITCLRVKDTFRGRAYGMQQASGTFGGLVAPLTAGWIGASFGMSSLFLFVSAILFAGAASFHILNRNKATVPCEALSRPEATTCSKEID